MFGFVAGVLRWNTRVGAFVLSLNDRYPPFTLEPDAAYPVDVVLERPPQSSRLYALFTIVVEIFALVAGAALFFLLIRHATNFDSGSFHGPRFDISSPGGNGLILRQIAALPHYIVLVALGVAAFVVWVVVQWVILVRAVYPRGMFDFSAGVVRWQTRVSGYALGLSDRYPPFTLDPSISLTAAGSTPPAWGSAAAPGAAPPPAWYADPAGRHAHRYWDGTQWTPHVADGEQTAYDPLEGPGMRAQSEPGGRLRLPACRRKLTPAGARWGRPLRARRGVDR